MACGGSFQGYWALPNLVVLPTILVPAALHARIVAGGWFCATTLGPPAVPKLALSSQNVAQDHREGLQNLVDPASSHMLVSKPFLKRSRARFLPGPPLITLRAISTEVGNPTLLHTEVGFPTAWRGPGAGLVLVRAWCGPGAWWCGPGNPVLGTGLQPQSCAGNRIASLNPVATAGLPRCTTSSSGLEPFLPEHSLVMEPALL